MCTLFDDNGLAVWGGRVLPERVAVTSALGLRAQLVAIVLKHCSGLVQLAQKAGSLTACKVGLDRGVELVAIIFVCAVSG